MSHPADLLLEPSPSSWGSLLGDPDARASRFRSQVGLPSDGRVVMSGHQAALWHPGILAKHFAASALARSCDAANAWLVVDQDDNDPTKLRVPVRTGDSVGVQAWDMTPGSLVPAGTPARERSTIEPERFTGTAHEAVRASATDLICDALGARSGEPSLAQQFTRAAFDLLGSGEPTLVHASELHKTELFAELLDAMRSDPAGAARSYNDACAAFADAGVRALAIRESAVELPLWRLRPGEPRMPVYTTQLADIPMDQLAPRALLMTAMVRMAGCDLFIHGTGGAAYDRITERWIQTWLSQPLAPMVVASATRTLHMSDEGLPSAEEIAEAKARAHSARHDPSILGDQATSERKAELLEQIEAAKSRGEKPAALFRQMQQLLAGYRERSADAIGALEREGQRMEGLRELSAIASDRTWAFALYPQSTIDELRRSVDDALGVV